MGHLRAVAGGVASRRTLRCQRSVPRSCSTGSGMVKRTAGPAATASRKGTSRTRRCIATIARSALPSPRRRPTWWHAVRPWRRQSVQPALATRRRPTRRLSSGGRSLSASASSSTPQSRTRSGWAACGALVRTLWRLPPRRGSTSGRRQHFSSSTTRAVCALVRTTSIKPSPTTRAAQFVRTSRARRRRFATSFNLKARSPVTVHCLGSNAHPCLAPAVPLSSLRVRGR